MHALCQAKLKSMNCWESSKNFGIKMICHGVAFQSGVRIETFLAVALVLAAMVVMKDLMLCNSVAPTVGSSDASVT